MKTTTTKIQGKDVEVDISFHVNRYGQPLSVDLYQNLEDESFFIIPKGHRTLTRKKFISSTQFIQKKNQLLDPIMTPIKVMEMIVKIPSIGEQVLFDLIRKESLTIEQAYHELKLIQDNTKGRWICGRGHHHVWHHRVNEDGNECVFRLYAKNKRT